MTQRRIVVIRPGALGDTLLTFPALDWLRRWASDARLTLIARRDTLPLGLASGLADAAWAYDLPDWLALFADDLGATPARREARATLTPLAQATLSGADLVVAWLADPAGVVARNLRALGVARIVIAPGRPPLCNDVATAGATTDRVASTQHAAAYLLDSLASLISSISSPTGAPPAPTHDQLASWLPRLRPSVEDQRGALAVWRELALPFAYGGAAKPGAATRRVIALHPGSGGAAKRWPPASFAALAGTIALAGDIPLLIEGPADAEAVAEVIAGRRREQENVADLPVARGLSVGALAALLRRCAAYVGNDSGVAHLAGLLGLPTVALFGPTNPAIWAPLGRAVWVIRAPGGELASLSPMEVAATLSQALDSAQSRQM